LVKDGVGVGGGGRKREERREEGGGRRREAGEIARRVVFDISM
jgi:hypothetical protein